MAEDETYQRIVLKGSWLYGGTAPSPIRIVKQNYDFWYEIGKADDQLEPGEEEELNEEGTLYYVIFKACEHREKPWWVDSHGLLDLEAAMRHAEERVQGKVTWEPGTEQ